MDKYINILYINKVCQYIHIWCTILVVKYIFSLLSVHISWIIIRLQTNSIDDSRGIFNTVDVSY